MGQTASKNKDKVVIPIIVALSIVVPIAVAVLMFLPNRVSFGGADLSSLPFFHAILNGSTAVLLFTGFVLIKNKNKVMHRLCMLSAFGLSAVFLVSYVISKLSNEPVPYGGEGIMRPIYFFILITHIILATAILPMALLSIYRGISGEYAKHRKIAKWTFPIWLYVAITGVLVYLFMMPYYA